MNKANLLTRRRAISSILKTTALVGIAKPIFGQVTAPAGVQNDHDNRIKPPRPVPDIPVSCDDDRKAGLSTLLKERATALQLVFTECTTTCPIQAATFAHVQKLIPDQTQRGIQLLSLSVDPLADSPSAMHAWLQHFGARPGWIAVAPRFEDLKAIRGFFGDEGKSVMNHGTSVNLINHRGELIWRTFEMPSAESIAAMLSGMARMAVADTHMVHLR